MYIYVWLPWPPDLCKLNQNEADCEFILSPSELMSGRGVSVGSKVRIRLLRRSQLAIVLRYITLKLDFLNKFSIELLKRLKDS